jgi:hypothetical protein
VFVCVCEREREMDNGAKCLSVSAFLSFVRHFCFVSFLAFLSSRRTDDIEVLYFYAQSLFAKKKKFLHCVSLKDCSDSTLANFDIIEFFILVYGEECMEAVSELTKVFASNKSGS